MNQDNPQRAARQELRGSIPSLATPEEVRAALDRAFDYRGDVTITLQNGDRIEGYVFDRRSNGPSLADCHVRMFPKNENAKVSVSYADIVRLEFTGRDTAEGKSFEQWVKNYRERKARGDRKLSLEPDALDE